MARHAGFAAVATITRGLIDNIAAAYVEHGTAPTFFPAPTSVAAGGTTVSFAGIFEMLGPTVELHPNPADLVTIHFKFRSSLRARVATSASLRYRRYDVEVGGAVNLGLITQIVNNQVVVGINTQAVTFGALTVRSTGGAALPPAVVQALQSPALAAAATALVRSRPNLMLTQPVLDATIEKVQPGNFKDSGISIFEWFRISLTASRVVVKPLEGVLNVAVDFAGYTRGDPNALVDLTSTHGGGVTYVRTITPQQVEQGLTRDPYVVRHGYPAGGSMAVLFNMAVVSRVAESISSQTSGTRIAKGATLLSLSLGYSTFTKPLYPGQRDGLRLGFKAKSHPGGVVATGAVYIHPMFTTFDGPTDFLRPPYWSLLVAHSELSVPWYVDFAIVAFATFLSILVPYLMPIFAVAALTVVSGIIPSLLDNARGQAQNAITSGVMDVGLPSIGTTALPGLPGAVFTTKTRHVAITAEGIDASVNASASGSSAPSQLAGPTEWHAEYKEPMAFSLQLSQRLAAMSGNLSLVWEVFRGDTNALVSTVTRPYVPARDSLIDISTGLGSRGGVRPSRDSNGITVGLRHQDLYLLDSIKVRCTVTATVGDQVGEIWSTERVVVVQDNLDRRHKFVHWGPHMVYFANAGTGGETWSHDRTSRIHRTACGARCLMLRRNASRTARTRPTFRYTDALPYSWAHLYQNRHYLCEYCFFGGPDKTKPFPEHDWF